MKSFKRNDLRALEKEERPVSTSNPYRVSLPGFLSEDVGLGDAIKRITYAAGIKPCDGCERRATALNHWIVFGR
jgi:hypothetical protein